MIFSDTPADNDERYNAKASVVAVTATMNLKRPTERGDEEHSTIQLTG